MVDFDVYVDLMCYQFLYLNLKIFYFKGVYIEVLVDVKVDDLLDDLLIIFYIQLIVDLDVLVKIFLLQESVIIMGKLDVDMGMKCCFFILKKQDIGCMKLGGKFELKDFELKDIVKDFDFLGNVIFCFCDNEILQVQMDVCKLVLRSCFFFFDIEWLVVNVFLINLQDINCIVFLQCDMEVSKFCVLMGDFIKLYSVCIKV